MGVTQGDECEVLLVGIEAQENLGLRSLAAFLNHQGIGAGIQPMQDVSKETVLRRIEREKPKIVGFSLIFQRMLDAYADLIGYLRENGVGAHFTMGGHFPTFAFEEVLSAIPRLDTVVRHEGEETILELFHKVDQPDSWKDIQGLAYRTGNSVRANPLRPLISNLDSLPFPVRDTSGITHRGIGIRSIAGSRGCYYNCGFCSISEFYRRPPGAVRRTRSPVNVIREMLTLYESYGAQIFIFQDDDLFMRTNAHRQWLDEFLCELEQTELSTKVLWRISCRVDDMDIDYLRRMKEAGLVSIYLGIESANDTELATMNKGYKAIDVYRAIDLLHEVDMPFEFGFMLFTPDSSLETVMQNLDFLKFVAGGSNSLVHFCKMSPYAGTPIQHRLQQEGRLEGSLACPDYRFLDAKVDLLQAFSAQTFNLRNFSDEGLVERLRFAKFDICVLGRLLPDSYDTEIYERSVRELIRRCNGSALDAMTFAGSFVNQNSENGIMQYWHVLDDVRHRELAEERRIASQLDALMSEYGFVVKGSAERWPSAA